LEKQDKEHGRQKCNDHAHNSIACRFSNAQELAQMLGNRDNHAMKLNAVYDAEGYGAKVQTVDLPSPGNKKQKSKESRVQ
jgi:hypothetical protein